MQFDENGKWIPQRTVFGPKRPEPPKFDVPNLKFEVECSDPTIRKSLLDRIRRDFQIICHNLKFSSTDFTTGRCHYGKYLADYPPALTIAPWRSGSEYRFGEHRIILGIRDGYRRSSLVHECIHASGKSHDYNLRFTSNSRNDLYTPKIERMIFEKQAQE